MVPAMAGRSGPKTAFGDGWYRLAMPPSRVRAALLFSAAVLVAVAAAGCLPPPNAATDASSSPAASSGPSGTPRPSATPKPQDLAIAAFVKQVAGGKLTYRISFNGDVRLSADALPITGAMDVAGKDFATSFTYNLEPEYPGLGKTRIQVRGVGTKGWIKRGSAAWQPIKNYGLAHSYVPFKTVRAAADVRYVGAAKVSGKTFHTVVVRDALLIHPNTIPYAVTNEKVDDSEIEFLIDDAGRPRSGTWTLRAQARVGASGQLQRVVYDLKVTFSKVGAKVSVKRP
jgi:hypothetical protein